MDVARAVTGFRKERLAGIYRSTPLIAFLLAGIALLPRLAGLADFITTDEAYHWILFTERFSDAIAERRWAETVLTGHPGVTLWWLGGLGLALERAAVAQSWASVTSQVEHLGWLRLPGALFEVACVPAAFLLLRRLVAPATALIATLLWATSPYMIAHARVLHLDALLTSFVTFSVLMLLLATNGTAPDSQSARSRRWWLVGSGCCAGLALLTKAPALILLPTCGLLLLWRVSASRLAARLGRAVSLYAVWLGAALLVFVLLWPAMWVDPGRALGAYFDEILSNGGRPNGDGQFFLGQAVGDPGPLYYLVANLMHTTPAIVIGLLALLGRGVRSLAAGRPTGDSRQGAIGSPAERGVLLALAVFALLWTLAMTLGPKKFDRYTLPTWPALLVFAAAGWTYLIDKAGSWAGSRRSTFAPAGPAWPRVALVALLLGLELIPLPFYHPYYLSYFNPLFGGGATAQRTLIIGWGEAMDQVGAYLRARPDIGHGPILSALPRTLRPFVPVPVKDVVELGKGPANYAVVYLESIQRGANPEIYAAIRQTVPLHRITLFGIDYADIHQLPRPFDRPVDARFGEAIRLAGVTLAHEPARLVVTPAWDVRAAPQADYQVFLHLIDSGGRVVAQVDVAPGGADAGPTSAWQAGQQIGVPLPLPLPADLPAGEYQLTLGLYDVRTGARVAPSGGRVADPALAGPNALLLDTIR